MLDGTGTHPPVGGPPPLLPKRDPTFEEAMIAAEHERRRQGNLPICPKPVKIDTRNLDIFQRYFANTSSVVQNRGENKICPPLLPLTPPCSPTKNQLSSKLFSPPHHKQRPHIFSSSIPAPIVNTNGQVFNPRRSSTKIFFPGRRQGNRCSRSHHHEHRIGRAHRHIPREREFLDGMHMGQMLPRCRQPNLVVTRGTNEVIVIPDSPPVFSRPVLAPTDSDPAKADGRLNASSTVLHQSVNLMRRTVSHDEGAANGGEYQSIEYHRSMSADCVTNEEVFVSSPIEAKHENEAIIEEGPPSAKKFKINTSPSPEDSTSQYAANDIKEVYEKEFPANWLAQKVMETQESISVSRDVEKIQQKITKVDNARSSLIELQEVIFARCEEPPLEQFEDKVYGFGMRFFLSQIRSLIKYYDSELRLLRFYLTSPPPPPPPPPPSPSPQPPIPPTNSIATEVSSSS